MIKFKSLWAVILMTSVMVGFTSCDDDDKDDPKPVDPDPKPTRIFNVAADVEPGTDGGIYVLPTTDLNNGKLSFVGNGMELYSVRSARVMARNNYVYNLDYGGGKLYQFMNHEDAKSYMTGKQLDVSLALDGETYVRPTMVDDNTILVHTVTTESKEDDKGNPVVTATMRVASVQIPEMKIKATATFVIPETEWDTEEKRYVGRVDCPVVMGNKVYYGVMRRTKFSEPTPPNTGVHSIVLDYPSLENPKYIRSEIANGSTNGYRGTSALKIGDYIYQLNQFWGATKDEPTVIVRLKGGKYDESYSFNVTEALGMDASYANSWYYAGNNIAYMPISDESLGGEDSPHGKNNTYTIARIDMEKKTVVKMNVPYSDMFKYQSGVAHDGKFYMAISPNPKKDGTVQKANIYAFDINSEDPDAFTTGADLDEGSIFIQGIY